MQNQDWTAIRRKCIRLVCVRSQIQLLLFQFTQMPMLPVILQNHHIPTPKHTTTGLFKAWQLLSPVELAESGTYLNAHSFLFLSPFFLVNLSFCMERHAIVEELVGFGAKVHTCARNEDDLNKCLNEWNHLDFEVTGSICDVSVPHQRDLLMETVSSLFHGKLNILVSSLFFPLCVFYHAIKVLNMHFLTISIVLVCGMIENNTSNSMCVLCHTCSYIQLLPIYFSFKLLSVSCSVMSLGVLLRHWYSIWIVCVCVCVLGTRFGPYRNKWAK